MKRYSIGLILFSIFIMNNVCGQQTDKKKSIWEKYNEARTEKRLKDLEQSDYEDETLNMLNLMINNNKNSVLSEEGLTNKQLINKLILNDKDKTMFINNLIEKVIILEEKVILLEDKLYYITNRVEKLDGEKN